MRLLATVLAPFFALALPVMAAAEGIAGHFENRAAYESFIDSQMKARNFSDAVHKLGGGDEYSEQELTAIADQLRAYYPQDFTHAAILRSAELGQGFRQEARAYWSEPEGRYLYFYALLHQRDDALIVLSFSADTEADVIMGKF